MTWGLRRKSPSTPKVSTPVATTPMAMAAAVEPPNGAPAMGFPLPDDYFPQVVLSEGERNTYRAKVNAALALALEAERPLFVSNYRSANNAEWKCIKTKGTMRFYKSTTAPVVHEDDSNAVATPSVMSIGTIEGTLEDAIYGVYHASTPEMRATTRFLGTEALDSAVLCTIDRGTEEDRFRYLGLKWRVTETPGRSLVKNRDSCVLEYMGISTDAHGDRFAFHVAESVDHPMCPPFSSKLSLRASTHVQCIYRQLRPGVVGVFLRGSFSMAGRIPAFIARRAMADIFFSVGRSIECAEAKKLTMLAQQRGDHSVLTRPGAVHSSVVANASCGICLSTVGYLSAKSMSWCQVCCKQVCSNCRTRKHLLVERSKVKISCCKQCIVDARELYVEPNQGFAPISIATMLGYDAIASGVTITQSDVSEVSAMSVTMETSRTHDTDLDSLYTPSSNSSSDASTWMVNDGDISKLTISNYSTDSMMSSSVSTPTSSYGEATGWSAARFFLVARSLRDPTIAFHIDGVGGHTLRGQQRTQTTMRNGNVSFPLPRGYFGDVRLSSAEQNNLRQLAQSQVDAALAAERNYVHIQHGEPDKNEWRLVKKKEHLNIYRRRRGAKRSANNGATHTPAMLAIGCMEGTLEDVIFGSYDKTHDEMKMATTFNCPGTKDCTVLSTIEMATLDDPYHYLGLKWMASQLPAPSFLLKDRDWCYLESLGITADSNGERYGYHVVHSVDQPNCPAFRSRSIVRAQAFFTFIYRQDKRGMVDVFAQGSFDPAGEMVGKFAVVATSEILSGVFRTVRCAEAKKLTLLALDPVSFEQRIHRNKKQRQLSASSPTGECCSLCSKVKSTFDRLRACRVCGMPVCAKCRVKKHIFAGEDGPTRVPCCQNCIVKAKTMNIRPAEVDLLSDHSHILKHLLLEHQHDDGTQTSYHGSQSNGVKRGSLHESDYTIWRASLTDTNATNVSQDEDHEEILDACSQSPQPHHRPSLVVEEEVTVTALAERDHIMPCLPPTHADEALAHQQALIWKMMQLRTAAEQAYELTQASGALMRSAEGTRRPLSRRRYFGTSSSAAVVAALFIQQHTHGFARMRSPSVSFHALIAHVNAFCSGCAMKFPLPQNALPHVDLDSAYAIRLQKEAEGLVQHHMRAYETHLYEKHGQINFNQWKLIRQRENVAVYKRQRRSDVTPKRQPSKSNSSKMRPCHVMGLGTIAGTVEDAIYGMMASTTKAMKLRTSYIKDGLIDAAVLQTLVAPTPEDPLRLVALKWMVKKSALKNVIRHRDFVFIESMGVRRNAHGEKIGYHLMHSVEVPPSMFPPHLVDQLHTVRAKLSFCYLYRQLGSNTIDYFLRGCAEPFGNVHPLIGALSAADGLAVCWRSIRAAEMNKLAFFFQLHTQLRVGKPSSEFLDNRGCQLCQDEFNVISSGDSCQLCQQMHCSKCIVFRKMSFLVDNCVERVVRRRIAICTTCMMRVKNTSAEQIAVEQIGLAAADDKVEYIERFSSEVSTTTSDLMLYPSFVRWENLSVSSSMSIE
ncbi:TPA: hypothetical protein N0F65_000266 [Lagenidium giganteum]|uniref:FYVE-type domain-containing protein n=1 Tax=Lagenidium giganteum TaxID=4803 RepID=A0AAV2Z7M5_9STRA|nr:TPA: hypothetical protein N0F65_000266 [Lagenidium giganteum]